MKKILLFILLAGPCCLAGNVDFYIGTTGEHMYEVSWDGKQFCGLKSYSAPQCSYAAIAGPGEVYVTSTKSKSPSIATYRDGKCVSRSAEPAFASCFILPAGNHPYILTAQYGHGSLAVNKLDGHKTGAMVQFLEFEGSGPHKNQTSAHLHQVRQLPPKMAASCGVKGEWYMATDLGSDKLYFFEYVEHSADSILRYHPELNVSHKPGSGPRHLEFNTNFNLVYCVTELSDEVVTYKLSGKSGLPVLTEVSRIHADNGWAEASADIHMTPGGEYLYSSHRKSEDGIAMFSVSQADGMLTRRAFCHTDKHPRNFVISPDGKQLFVACRDSKTIQVFDINPKNGTLKEKKKSKLMLDEGPIVIIVKPGA